MSRKTFGLVIGTVTMVTVGLVGLSGPVNSKQYSVSKSLRLTPFLAACLGLAVVMAGLITQPAHADAIWNGSTDNLWSTGANWTGGAPGTGNNDVIINNAGANNPTLLNTNGSSSRDVRIGTAATGQLNQTTGTLDTGNGNWFFLGYAGGTATHNLTATTTGSPGTYTGFDVGSGSLNVGGASQNGQLLIALDDGTTGTFNMNTTGTLYAGYVEIAGGNGTGVSPTVGTFNLDGGTVNVSGATSVGRGGNNSRTQTGTLRISGGTYNSGGNFEIGFAGSASASATATVSGGVLNVGTGGASNLVVGFYDPMNATLNVTGSGVVNLQNGSDLVPDIGQNNSGTRTINVDGGQILGTAGSFLDAGYGNLGVGSSGTNVVNIKNGGILAVQSIFGGGDADTQVNFDNGTLRAVTNDDGFINFYGNGSQTVNVLGGGATIDTNSFNPTSYEGFLDGGGGGGLTKINSGTLRLAATNTYTGATTVTGGTLALGAAGSISTSPLVDLKAGATLDTTAQSFTMLGSQTLKFTLDASGAGSAGLLNAASLDISAGVVDFAQFATLDDPAYIIASYTSLTGPAFNTVNNLPSGYTLDYNYLSGNQIALVVPEPGTFVMLLGGPGLLAMFRRRRLS
ncbi:MAG: hypothetical protein RLZZ440_2177 [Planctomycetota bacterium]